MLVQMGYVVLFSAAFPLAGVCALINNLMEIRSDAFKLAHVHQRPFGQRVANIGTWQNALSILSLAAVIVNCALIGLSGQVSRLWPGLTTAQTIILIVTLEVSSVHREVLWLSRKGSPIIETQRTYTDLLIYQFINVILAETY